MPANKHHPAVPAILLSALLLPTLSWGQDSPRDLLTTFRHEFVVIEPGKPGFPANEEIPASFAIAKYEVPQNLFHAVMGNNPSRWKGPRNSAEMFDYNQAKEFCTQVTKMLREAKLIDADEAVRLPTEAEWEYCCRSGTTTRYSFGDDANQLTDYGWYHGNAAGNDPPVGAKKPNPWGLYDMHGYLWEFCTPSAQVETDSNAVPQDRCILRGGSWTSNAQQCESGSRKSVADTHKAPDVGFRCVLSKLSKK